MPSRRAVARAVAYLAVWLLGTVVAGTAFFLHSEREVSLASHDAVMAPDLSGRVVLHTGPVLPDLRVDSGSRIGVDVRLGKTDAPSTEALLERYAFIASQPEGPIDKIEDAVRSMALVALLRGAAVGLLPPALWLLLGRERRRSLLRRLPTARGALAVALAAAAVVALWSPWSSDEEAPLVADDDWVSLDEFLTPLVLPDELDGVEVLTSATTAGTRRLVESAVSTYEKSLTYYAEAAEAAADLDLRGSEDGETVVVLVSDRHDNIGMDEVARAVADRAGATGVLNAGDDTSTGSKWEAFSLDSVTASFDDLDRWSVTGNHDHGDFVGDYLADHGWTVLDGEVVDGPGGGRLLGVGDPRSSGLGSWRDETDLSFDEVAERLADAACAADEEGERVSTVLVHDANLGDETLARGCADLVVGGHLHRQGGPTAATGENDEVGYSYTNGTTGGAAYAIALGNTLRRAAGISLITYDEDGRPVGVQDVTLETSGEFVVGEYAELTY